MSITTTFAYRVRELNRQGLPLEAIALRLRASDDDARWAHQVFNLEPVGGEGAVMSYFRKREPIVLPVIVIYLLFAFDLWAIGFMIWNCWQLWGPK